MDLMWKKDEMWYGEKYDIFMSDNENIIEEWNKGESKLNIRMKISINRKFVWKYSTDVSARYVSKTEMRPFSDRSRLRLANGNFWYQKKTFMLFSKYLTRLSRVDGHLYSKKTIFLSVICDQFFWSGYNSRFQCLDFYRLILVMNCLIAPSSTNITWSIIFHMKTLVAKQNEGSFENQMESSTLKFWV